MVIKRARNYSTRIKGVCNIGTKHVSVSAQFIFRRLGRRTNTVGREHKTRCVQADMIGRPDSRIRSRLSVAYVICGSLKLCRCKNSIFFVLHTANSRLLWQDTFSFPAFPFQTSWRLCKSLRDDAISPSFITFVFLREIVLPYLSSYLHT